MANGVECSRNPCCTPIDGGFECGGASASSGGTGAAQLYFPDMGHMGQDIEDYVKGVINNIGG